VKARDYPLTELFAMGNSPIERTGPEAVVACRHDRPEGEHLAIAAAWLEIIQHEQDVARFASGF